MNLKMIIGVLVVAAARVALTVTGLTVWILHLPFLHSLVVGQGVITFLETIAIACLIHTFSLVGIKRAIQLALPLWFGFCIKPFVRLMVEEFAFFKLPRAMSFAGYTLFYAIAPLGDIVVTCIALVVVMRWTSHAQRSA